MVFIFFTFSFHKNILIYGAAVILPDVCADVIKEREGKELSLAQLSGVLEALFSNAVTSKSFRCPFSTYTFPFGP